MANSPRAYRETIAEALRGLFPEAGVQTAEPESLDTEIEHLLPDVVVCDWATEAVRDAAVSWVELYPEYGSRSVVCVEGDREEVDEIQLSDLISIIERAQQSRLG